MPLDIPMRFEDAPLLWTVESVYSQAECADFIGRIESASPALATNNPLYRDQGRVIVDDPVVAADLFRRLRPCLPERLGTLELDRTSSIERRSQSGRRGNLP